MMDPPCTWPDSPLCAWAAGLLDKPSSTACTARPSSKLPSQHHGRDKRRRLRSFPHRLSLRAQDQSSRSNKLKRVNRFNQHTLKLCVASRRAHKWVSPLPDSPAKPMANWHASCQPLRRSGGARQASAASRRYRNMKARLRPGGVVANPRDTSGIAAVCA